LQLSTNNEANENRMGLTSEPTKMKKSAKKNQYQTLLVVICLSTVLLPGCKKDEADLIEGTWHQVKIEQRTNANPWQDNALTCNLDDTETFEKDGKWTLYDGLNQCQPGTGIRTGTWRLTASDTKVIFTYTGVSGEYESTVETLTENNLVLSHSSGDQNNTQFRNTYTK
jgi:hypothetical protein